MAKKHETYAATMKALKCVFIAGWFKQEDEAEIRAKSVNKTKLKQDEEK